MCAKCLAFQNSFQGRYGAIMEAAKREVFDLDKEAFDSDREDKEEGLECENYRRMMRSLWENPKWG